MVSSLEKFKDKKYAEVVTNPSIHQDIIQRSEEIKKLVSDDFKPFSSKTGDFFEKLGNTIKDKMSLFIAGTAVLIPVSASTLYGSVNTAENIMYGKVANITMNNGLGETLFNYDQTMGLAGAAVALVVSHFALPPIAKAISKMANNFELKKYFAENDTAINKFVGAMEKLGDGRSKEHLEVIAINSRDNIIDSLKDSRLAENPSVREKIREVLEDKVETAFNTSVKRLDETSLSR